MSWMTDQSFSFHIHLDVSGRESSLIFNWTCLLFSNNELNLNGLLFDPLSDDSFVVFREVHGIINLLFHTRDNLTLW